MTALNWLARADPDSIRLCLAHVALGGYALSITRLVGTHSRVAAAGVVGAAAVGVAVLAPTCASAVILLAAGIVAVAALAGGAWTLWALFAPEAPVAATRMGEPASQTFRERDASVEPKQACSHV